MNSIIILPQNTSYFQVERFDVYPFFKSLNITLVNPLDISEKVFLELNCIVYFMASRVPEDEGIYQIGDIQVTSIDDGSTIENKCVSDYLPKGFNEKCYELVIYGDMDVYCISTKFDFKHQK